MTENQFDELELTPNHLDDNASFDGNMFETYGEEIEFVKSLSESKRVVTIVESEDSMYYIKGLHWVNRLGFLILAEPCDEEFEILIEGV